MLVYGTKLRLSATTDIMAALTVVSRWLSRKVGQQLSPDPFLESVERTFKNSHQVRSVAAVDEFPKVVALSYSHPDSQVGGRLWTTEVGFRRASEGADLECTILLSTSEISARVTTPVQVTRPQLVTELVDRCDLSNATNGTRIHTVGTDDADALRHVVLDSHRDYSLVIISPDRAGMYPADAQRLSSLLLGLADIVVITPDADTFWLSRAVGKDYVPYHGAVRLVYPVVRRFDTVSAPTWLFTAGAISDLVDSGKLLESEILSLVVHRSNLRLSWSHITLQLARDLRTQRVLAQKRVEAAKSGNAQEYAHFLEEHTISLENDIDKKKGTIASLEKLVAAQDDKERELKYDNDALKHQLSEARWATAGSTMDAEDRFRVATAIRSVVNGQASPEVCLQIVEHLYSDRVVILPEAWTSTRASSGFKYGGQLYGLLDLLATTYWEALQAGKPDADARQCFGKAYAAKESETVEKRKDARERRTFIYRGTPIVMFRHLKIGVKDSAAETIRVHFEWVADESVIVIGHCGPHIPFK